MTWVDFEKAQRNAYLDPVPTQITCKKWHDALEVLPPMAWGIHGGVQSFLMSEYFSVPYTSQYAILFSGDDTTYWTAMVDATDKTTWMTAEQLSKLPLLTPVQLQALDEEVKGGL